MRGFFEEMQVQGLVLVHHLARGSFSCRTIY